MEIWKGSYIEVPDLVQIFNNEFPIPTKNDCFHVNKKTASVVIFTYFLNEKKTRSSLAIEKKPFSCLYFVKGQIYAILLPFI